MFSLLFITAILSCDTSCVDMEKLKNIYDNVSFIISEYILPVQIFSDCCAFCDLIKVEIKMFIFQFSQRADEEEIKKLKKHVDKNPDIMLDKPDQ